MMYFGPKGVRKETRVTRFLAFLWEDYGICRNTEGLISTAHALEPSFMKCLDAKIGRVFSDIPLELCTRISGASLPAATNQTGL
jgi:hypothetical protein